MKGSRQFLCKQHYIKFRYERERSRIKLKREGYEITIKDGEYHQFKTNKVKEYNTNVGTTDFGAHLTKNKENKPDFKKEAYYIQNEKKRIWNCRTIGDYANKFAGKAVDSHCTEERERLLDLDNLVYNEESNGFIQYDLEGIKVDEWAVDFEDAVKKKTKSLKEIYKDWKYQVECNTILR